MKPRYQFHNAHSAQKWEYEAKIETSFLFITEKNTNQQMFAQHHSKALLKSLRKFAWLPKISQDNR